MTAAAPTTSTAQAAPIPFRDASTAGQPSVGYVLGVTLLVLGSVTALAYWARRRGWIDRWRTGTVPSERRLAIVESLPLSRHTRIYRVRDGAREFLIAESTGQLQLLRAQGDRSSSSEEMT